MEKLLKHIEFDDQIVNADEGIRQYSTPIILRVKGQCLLSDQHTLSDDSIIVIHGRKCVGVLKGKDSSGKDLNLFTTCPQTVQLALPENERKIFNSLEQLCLQESRPKFVEIKFGDENHAHESVKDGSRLKVLLVERGAKGPLFMHFRNEKGKHVRLPIDIKASFTACPPDGKEYSIREVANISKGSPALHVQFVQKNSAGSSSFNSFGVIEILTQSSVDLMFLTVQENGKLQCLICPTSEDLVGQIAKGAFDKTEEYEDLKLKISELAPVERFEILHGERNIEDSNFVLCLQTDKVYVKNKAKEKEKRARGLTIGNEEDSSEKKRNSFLALFKDVKRKEQESVQKKEKKNKKKHEKGRSQEETESLDKDHSDIEIPCEKPSNVIETSDKKGDLVVPAEEAEVEPEIIAAQGEELNANLKEEAVGEGKSKGKSAEEKKKWKFDLKVKLKGNEKKEKKKKGHKDEECIAVQQEALKIASEPCNPNSDSGIDGYEIPNIPTANAKQNKQTESPHKEKGKPKTLQDSGIDGYEIPNIPTAIAKQNKQTESPHKEKGKPKTLISRTWKRMKKKQRRSPKFDMQRSYSDAAEIPRDRDCTDSYGDDSPPPLMDPDYPEEIYEQIPGEFMSQDIYEEAVRAYGSYEPGLNAQAETCDSGFDEFDKKQIDTLREFTVPPPLPGNHPKMQPRSSLKGENSRLSVDSEGFKRFYETMKKSENLIRSWGPDEIENALNDLQLGHHAEKFNESQIDGTLLFDLDEAVLRDLGLSLFEARKLRKFVFGWRPDRLRDTIYQQNYNQDSKNPSHWSTPIVAEMISKELGIPELGKFCEENQVNGDLLRDIIIDDELLEHLLKGKASKLNAVKLKNFVLDGWRPPKKKEAHYEIFTNQNTMTADESSYEPLSPSLADAPNMYEIPTTSPTPVKSGLQPFSVENRRKGTEKIETVSPLGSSVDKKLHRAASEDKPRVSFSNVNSLMKKYEKKSSNVDAPRPFTKASLHRSSGTSGNNNRDTPKSPLVSNMTKKFNEK